MKCSCYQGTTAGDGREECRKEGCAAIHNMEFALPRLASSNPNNCDTCEWKAHDDKGHCYMFFDEPTEVCMQHTGRKRFRAIGVPHSRGKDMTAMLLLLHSIVGLEPISKPPFEPGAGNTDRDADEIYDAFYENES